MSQTIDDAVETPALEPKTIIPISTPAYQVTGGQIYQLNFETKASQVRTSDGSNVETRLTTLERAVSGTPIARIVQTIADRDALVGAGVNVGDRAYVLDASDDETVESGAAVYLFMADNTWLKLSEEESQDVVATWDKLEGKPESTPTSIDLAVAKQHQHENSETLDQLDSDNMGLTFKGVHLDRTWVARGDTLADVPSTLADGGLFFLNAQG